MLIDKHCILNTAFFFNFKFILEEEKETFAFYVLISITIMIYLRSDIRFHESILLYNYKINDFKRMMMQNEHFINNTYRYFNTTLSMTKLC